MTGHAVPISTLPLELGYHDAVEAAYGESLDRIADKLLQHLSVLVECDKQLVLYLYKALQRRIKSRGEGVKLRLISGHKQRDQQDGLGGGDTRMQRTLAELQEAVFSGEEGLLLVIPHLDILTTTTQSGLNADTREAAAVLYENPDVVFLAFRDPSFEIPRIITNVFGVRENLVGISRDRLPQLVTQREARKLAVDEFRPFSLYKYFSGQNAIRIRQVLSHFRSRLDYDPNVPHSAESIYREIREMTVAGDLEVPRVDLASDIGGYDDVKRRIREDWLELLQRKELLSDPAEASRIEELLPKGLILHGPPGTGKTFFAKAMATALDAAITIVSGPELKSKWVGESEENLRRVFAQARKSAPALIVFDELDSFASARGTYTGSGVEHSMVNQLLTEMDGFRTEELVFVIGTTNLVESLDPALLRPGRFELTIHVPYPDSHDRREIVDIYRRKFDLDLPDDVLDHLVEKTAGYVDRQRGIRFSGDHLYAVARTLKRDELRNGRRTLSDSDVETAISGRTKSRIKLQAEEERTIAAHEAGHALCAYVLPHCPTIERVTIATGEEDTLGYVMHAMRQNQYVTTRAELLDDVCVLLAGRVAESVIVGEVSMGAYDDLQRANELVRVMVEELGMSDQLGSRVFASNNDPQRREPRPLVAETTRQIVDHELAAILDQQAERAAATLSQYEPQLRQLTAKLLQDKTLDESALRELFPGQTFKAGQTGTE